MKFHIDVDMTPEEARAFLGLPDVAPVQEKVLKEMEKRMLAALDADPQSLMRAWMPGGEGLEQFQRAMWSAAERAAGGKGEKPR